MQTRHKNTEWRLQNTFFGCVAFFLRIPSRYIPSASCHARTHTHIQKRTERTGKNRGKYTANYTTQNKQHCVRCTASLTKAFFTVKMPYGRTVPASAYFYLCPSKRTASPEPIFTKLAVSTFIPTHPVPNFVQLG
jgi:hypothetical protein